MDNLRLKSLLDKYLAKTISFGEEQELFDLLSSDSSGFNIKQYLLKKYTKGSRAGSLNDRQSERILSSIMDRLKTGEVINPKKSHKQFSPLSWAAALVIIASGIILLYTVSNKKHNNSLAKISALTRDVSPGTTGAILRLSDGSQVLLDSNNTRNTIKQGNTLVVNQGSSLAYINNPNTKNQKFVGNNVVETLKGNQYHLSLEDGTKVWLNAESSITFPVAFIGNERNVSITGEVYFEVAKNKKKPFRVNINGTTIEVLGTHFNVNSYGDNGKLSTTLLEGSIKITDKVNQKILKPGDEALVQKNGVMSVQSNVNTDVIIAWKNNYFSFNNIDIKTVMTQLSRWYNVEVIYKDKIDDSTTFNGYISRSVNLSTILKMLESTGAVSFSIDGKKVIVGS